MSKATIQATELAAVCAALKDCRDAALAIPAALSQSETRRMVAAFDSQARTLCAILKPHNPKFDVTRFLNACGMGTGAES